MAKNVDYPLQMPYMWADALQRAEGAHLLRVVAWGAASLLAGTALLAWLRASNRDSRLLHHFAIQSCAWGTVEVAMALELLAGLAPRDLASATRLDRVLWLTVEQQDGKTIYTGAFNSWFASDLKIEKNPS